MAKGEKIMDWMNNRYSPEYKVKYKSLVEGIDRLYGVLGIVRHVPDAPATRRYDMDAGKVIKLGRQR